MPTSFETPPIEIDVVAFQAESGVWVGQCIQYDIAAHADSLPKLWKALEREVVANLCLNAKLGRPGLEGIPPAPEKFRNGFDHSEYRVARNPKRNANKTPVRLQNVAVVEAV